MVFPKLFANFIILLFYIFTGISSKKSKTRKKEEKRVDLRCFWFLYYCATHLIIRCDYVYWLAQLPLWLEVSSSIPTFQPSSSFRVRLEAKVFLWFYRNTVVSEKTLVFNTLSRLDEKNTAVQQTVVSLKLWYFCCM